MKYFLMHDGSVMRDPDLAVIPPTEDNADWRQYLADVKAGAIVEPFDYAAEEARQNAAAAAFKNEAIKAKLEEIDKRSIRAIREYIAAKPDAPQILKDREAEAIASRQAIRQ
jgi:hypothetical protein